MAKEKGQYEIPFDQDGNLLGAASRWYNGTVVWKANYRFQDELEYVGYSIGRSGASVYFKSLSENRKYNMSLGDFDDIIKAGIFNNKIVRGEFTFAKRGTRYMLTPLLPKLP